MLELVKRNLAAFASADWDAFKADLAADVVYDEIPTGKTANGSQAYLNSVRQWKTAFPDVKATIQRFHALNETAVAEVIWEGTHRGPLDTPIGTQPATNKKVRVSAVLINRIRDGKIAETRHYFDLMTLLRQIQAAMVSRPEAEPAQPVRH